MNNNILPPQPGQVLYKNLFEVRQRDESIELISDGLNAILKNVNRLILDVEILTNSNHFSSAHFLLTTAKEEMAKSYIFLDMCRLNFSKHESALRCLCKAFYDHVLKYAYFQLNNFWPIHDMKHAKDIWKSETKKWWTNDDPTSGVPDMPHSTYFNRELPLYVEYIEYDQKWSIPDDEEESIHFEEIIGADIITKTVECFDKLKFTNSIGLFSPPCLTILNDEFQNYYIKENTDNSSIQSIYEKVFSRLITEHNIKPDLFIKSIFRGWPLYYFLTLK